MNLPNIITLFRLALIPIFIILCWTTLYTPALVVFFIASATDFLDGHIARVTNQQTRLGALLDPLVDKILVTAGLITLLEVSISVNGGPVTHVIPGWAVVLIIAREFLVTGLRTILMDHGVLLSAGNLGKLKTALQVLSIMIIYLALSIIDINQVYYNYTLLAGYILFYLAVIITIASGIQYVVKSSKYLNTKNEGTVI